MTTKRNRFGDPLRPGDTGYYSVLKDHQGRGLITRDEMLSLLWLHGFFLQHPPPPSRLDEALLQPIAASAQEARIIALMRQDLEDQ